VIISASEILTKLTLKKTQSFCDILATGASIKAACEAIGISRPTAYEWRKNDPKFKAAWDSALESGTDLLEDEAKRRALDNSDTLLIFLLKARRPQKYRDTLKLTLGDADKLIDESGAPLPETFGGEPLHKSEM